MQESFFDERFENKDYKKTPLTKGEYEQCNFVNCDFSGTDLSSIRFIDCSFSGCNLSLAKLSHTAFNETIFKHCKMLGLHFNNCNTFGLLLRFEHCLLNHSVFYQMKLGKTRFLNTQLQEADFSECDLSQAVFDNCDMAGAVFDRTILEKADLRTAYNYSIDPENNRIKKAKFSLPAVTGLLHKYDIEISPS